jgi:hypothetical protein
MYDSVANIWCDLDTSKQIEITIDHFFLPNEQWLIGYIDSYIEHFYFEDVFGNAIDELQQLNIIGPQLQLRKIFIK